MKLLLRNIRSLVQVRPADTPLLKGAQLKELPTLQDAWLLVDDGIIVDYGTGTPPSTSGQQKEIDCTGKLVLPAWIDSHTHIVYGGNREQEFVARLKGKSYQQIAADGGGILNSAKHLNSLSEDALFEQAARRLEAVMAQGTGAIEIKSGYGLTLEGELKMLRVAKSLEAAYPVTVKTTFLGAHALPEKYKDNKAGYMDLVIEQMLPAVVDQGLADYVDIFCESGYFDIDDTNRLLKAATELNLIPKIHVNQFSSMGGVQAGVQHQALTVDHLEVMEEADYQALEGSNTIPVALPGCSLFLGIPYTPGREVLDRGLPLALASDYNPGSAPSGNMNLVVALACIKMNLTPEEAINAATLNAAYAMGVEKELGSITKDKKANLIITKEIPSYGFIPYAFGSDLIDQVILNGTPI